MIRPTRLQRALVAALAAVVTAILLVGPVQADPASTAASIAPEESSIGQAGSYEVAPVRILGVPALVVASPQLHGDRSVVGAKERAAVIEGNLRLIYETESLCTSGEAFSEMLLEGLVLGGPRQQLACSSDPWGLHGPADQLFVERVAGPSGSVLLQARLPGRPEPLPLLTVTAADGQLHGLQPEQLAKQWQQVLQRRLRHARRTLQPDQLGLRLRITTLVELLLLTTTAISIKVWSRMRRHLAQQREIGEVAKARRVIWLTQISFGLVLLQGIAMVSIAVAAIPGRIPTALTLLLQPLQVLIQAAGVAVVVVALRLLLRLVLRQWRISPNVPVEQIARRQQRYQNLLQAGQRLLNLAGLILILVLTIKGLPGFETTTLSSWLAGGALLGALALVFQGLLRDFAAGLVVLLEDHYAVGDWVQVDALEGNVEDVGILATTLRAADQRVVVIPNSRCDVVVNHTRIRSGVELCLPLPSGSPHLEQALRALEEECALFGASPTWHPLLLEPPVVRGVKRITPLAVELSILLITRAGDQWAAERALLTQIVSRFEREQLPLAQATPTVS